VHIFLEGSNVYMSFISRRWLVILGAIGLHISIGSVYAWSVFTRPIMQYLNCSLSEVQFTFSLAIFFLGTTAAFFGKYIERFGPRKSGIIGAILFSTGMILGGYAIQMHSLIGLYLSYGFIGDLKRNNIDIEFSFVYVYEDYNIQELNFDAFYNLFDELVNK
jgi:MFS family permease